MTTNAYDGRYVASDKQATQSGLSMTCTKLYAVDGKAVCFSGNSSHGLMLLAWMRAGADPADWPAARGKHSAYMFVYEWGKPILGYEDHPVPIVLEDRMHATGSGRDFSIGAMAMGASAEKAVEIACRYDINSGMGITVIDLKELASEYDASRPAGGGADAAVGTGVANAGDVPLVEAGGERPAVAGPEWAVPML